MSKYDSSIYNVKIKTWGTKDKKTNGMDNYIDQISFGGNVGHVSIVMSLPINDETKTWIEQYCYDQTFEEYKSTIPLDNRNSLTFETYLKNGKQRIPTKQENNTTYTAKFNEEGVLKKTEAVAHTEDFFKIEFSFWPGSKVDGLGKTESSYF